MKFTSLLLVLALTGGAAELKARRPKPTGKAPKSTRHKNKQPKADTSLRQCQASRTTLKANVLNHLPASSLTALPEIPRMDVAKALHLESILPAPAPKALPEPSNVTLHAQSKHAITPSELQPVLPREDEADWDAMLPPTLAELPFEPADPHHLDLLWPVGTRSVSSGYGPRTRTRAKMIRVKNKSKKSKLRRVRVPYQSSHKGVDLTAPTGSDVFAAMDGKVVACGRHRQYGNYVILNHGNEVHTIYAHNHVNYVQEGEVVRRGQKIAEVGSTGHSTGPHVHLELRVNGVHQNPFPYLNDVEEIPAELVAQNESALPPEKSQRSR